MVWPFDPDESFVTPARAVELERERLGLTPEQFALPETMVATFQAGAYQRLLERAGVFVSADAGLGTDAPPVSAAAGQTPGSATRSVAGSAQSSTAEQPQPAGIALRTPTAIGEIGGAPVRVARLGVGAPAAALALEGAIARGVRNVLVVGSAGSLQRGIPMGATVVVESAEREDGTSHHYLPAGEVVRADAALSDLLEAAAQARGAAPLRGRSWTVDAPYRETAGAIRRHRDAGVAVVEMEAAAIFAVARVRGVRAALLVAVSDTLFDEWVPSFHHPTYVAALTRAADAAMDAAAALAGKTRR